MTRSLLWSLRCSLVVVVLAPVGCAAGDESVPLAPAHSTPSAEAGVDSAVSPTDAGSPSVDTGSTASEDTGAPKDPPVDPPGTDAAPPPSDCPTCVLSSCKAENDACGLDAACTARASCYTGCKGGADPVGCRAKCDVDNPSTAADAYLGCVASKCTMCKF
jgi:hypothetical protein